MQRNATDAVNLLKGLANESRLMIMCVFHGRRGFCRPTQSAHQNQPVRPVTAPGCLREQGLVQTSRESQTIYYRLADTAAMNIIELLREAYCEV